MNEIETIVELSIAEFQKLKNLLNDQNQILENLESEVFSQVIIDTKKCTEKISEGENICDSI